MELVFQIEGIPANEISYVNFIINKIKSHYKAKLPDADISIAVKVLAGEIEDNEPSQWLVIPNPNEILQHG